MGRRRPIAFQTQGIATVWIMGILGLNMEGNPVIKNEVIKDFRDPKMFLEMETNNWTCCWWQEITPNLAIPRLKRLG